MHAIFFVCTVLVIAYYVAYIIVGIDIYLENRRNRGGRR